MVGRGVLGRHEGDVNAVAVASGGEFVVSGGEPSSLLY